MNCKFGIKHPYDREPQFTLNTAVDQLLKNEFHFYRLKQKPHPLMVRSGIKGVPFWHRDMAIWLNPFRGMEYYDRSANLIVSGAPDDIWLIEGKLSIVDYKSSGSDKEHSIKSEYWESYRRQMEIYQWLLSRQDTGLPVSATGYFFLARAQRNLPNFNSRLEFETEVIPYAGNTDWVEQLIAEARSCLNSDVLPLPNPSCGYCLYCREVDSVCS